MMRKYAAHVHDVPFVNTLRSSPDLFYTSSGDGNFQPRNIHETDSFFDTPLKRLDTNR